VFREAGQEAALFLAYLDDSGSERRNPSVFVMGGPVLSHEQFRHAELMVGIAARNLWADGVPPDKFDEFHASDLFVGKGPFEGIPEADRHGALLDLVSVPGKTNAPCVYSAVDKSAVRSGPFGSANLPDVAFRMCICAVNDWTRDSIAAKIGSGDAELDAPHLLLMDSDFALLVVDEPPDRQTGEALRKSFPSMRKRLRSADGRWDKGRLQHLHDGLYFGVSSESVGLQIADACSWAMLRKLRDGVEDQFYKALMEGQVITAKVEPEWTLYRHAFMAHDDQ
jgi:hypothetical protein